MRNPRSRVAALAVWLVWGATAAVAQAQTSAPLSLTLDDAIARGVAHAPRLAEARAQEAAAASATAARRALALPSINVSAEYQRTNHVPEFSLLLPDGTFRTVFPDIPNMYWVRTELGVPIWPAGVARNAIDASRAEERGLAGERRAAEQDTRLEIIRAYWSLVLARENVNVLTQGQQRMDAWVADVKSKVDAGVLGLNEVLTAQAQRARQNVQLIQAKSAAAIAEVDLARLVGAPAGQSITTSTSANQPPAGAAVLTGQAAQTLVARALEGRGERVVLQEKKQSATFTGAAFLASRQPQVTGLASFSPARPNPRFAPRSDEWQTSWDLGVRVVWPLFDGGRAKANHAASVAQASAIDHRIEQFDALVSVEIRQRLLDVESGRAAVDASTEAVAAFTEARRVAQARFEAGVLTSTDVLDAQLALTEAEMEQVRLAIALRLSEARLLRAVGGL